MAVRADPIPSTHPRWVGWAAVPFAALAVVAGIWLAGGLVTDDFAFSMGLTAVWFVIVVGGALAAWRRVPVLRPAALAAVLTFVALGGYLGYTSTTDTTVDETVAAGPAAYAGDFRSLAHPTSGAARVVEQGGSRTLTLTGFRTDPGPDLYVYVVPGRATGEEVEGGTRLGRLKGNVGNQQYLLPAELDLSAGGTVVIWCRAFSVSFGAAGLRPS